MQPATIHDAINFAEDYCQAADGARAGTCYAAAWNIRDQFGWPIISGHRDGTPHHWNLMPDGRWFDPTAAQFGDNGPTVVDPTDPRYIRDTTQR